MEDLSIYNPDGSDLRKMQLRMLKMLIFIDSVCKKHDIKYWLAFGTLLGAVRHGGFIPWDDDLDIEMLKEDYDKFISIVENEMPDNMRLQTHKTDSFYVAPYAKLRDAKSIVFEVHNGDINYKYRGIYIDIFPVEKSTEKVMIFTGLLHSNLLYRITRIPKDKFGILKIILKLNYIILNSLYTLIRLIFKNVKTKNYFITFGSTLCKPIEESIFPLKKINFEGYIFNSPNDTDVYLKCIYGDYLSLPPLKDRRTHLLKVNFLEEEILL